MKKKIIGIVVCLLVSVTFAGAMPPANMATKSIGTIPVDRGYSHTIIGEYCTRAGCVPCYYAHTALKNIFANGWHPFYYVTLVVSKNKHAENRADELGLVGYPTVFWDGGYEKDLGATSVKSAMAKYNTSITKCGDRSVSDIDLSLNVTWHGAVNNDPFDGEILVPIEKTLSWTISEMGIDVIVDNKEDSQYNGHLHVYVTEVESSMGWKDNGGNPYTFAFLDYAMNKNISISKGSTWGGSTDWDGEDYHDGHGTRFDKITQNNTMVIATVFDEETDYSDETTGFVAGVGTDPKTFDLYFGNSTPPPKETSNITVMKFEFPDNLEWNTTYYWKIDVWDKKGNPTYGDIWSFTTRDNTPPLKPWAPNPPDNSTTAPINTNLSWKCSDPEKDKVTYDVYFGETSPEDPPLVASNITTNKYDPGILEFDTGYEWRIVAWDEYGLRTSGKEWSFRTQENEPPYKPSNPHPEDEANNVPVDAILNWTGGDPNPGDPLTYDVYFGRTNPPTKKSSNQTNTSYNPPGDMELYEDYYWKIVTWDSQGEKAEGDIWSFITGINLPPDKPTITGPMNGKVGEDYKYNFSTSDPENQNIAYKIEWGDGEGTGWLDFVASGTKITLNHTWDAKDEYTIRCKAKDTYGEESEWGTLEVTMPKNKAFNFNFNLLSWLFEQFPNAFLILQYLLGLK
ncbi:MAG: hypothetical protein JSW60_03260 [Thermoplasmatales archaeon]|nr:MAG: hypothetical protein JSW60_03260 [Thermoplasmatales archaeon]